MLGLSAHRAQGLLKRSDRREAERHKLHRLAKIQGKGGSLPRDCLIVDISDTGIRVHAENVEVPDEFIITITGVQQSRRECRVVWRLGFEIGAEFTDVRRGFAHDVVMSRM